MLIRTRYFALTLGLAAAACTASPRSAATDATLSAIPAAADLAFYNSIVAAPDRDAADVALDEGRHPAQTLQFFGIAPGMRIAEISAGGGYTAELLARTVTPGGVVYGHNAPFVLQRFAQAPWKARLRKPVMKNVARIDAEFVNAIPDNISNLDAVLMVLFYHDTVWQGVDRDLMNRTIFAALRPGGIYGIVDHSARRGSGLADVETLHRIDEAALRAEVEKAGFVLAAEDDFLRNPDDTRDWNASPRNAGEKRGTSDRFVLKFVKPLDGH